MPQIQTMSTTPNSSAVVRRLADGSVVVELSGDLDVEGSERVEATLLGALDGAERTFSIETSAVTFVDSAGLRLLLRARQHAQSLGLDFSLAHPSSSLVRLLRLTGLDDLVSDR